MFDSGKGSGNTFNWSITSERDKPIFVAGGLNTKNVVDAIKIFRPFAVDISSGVETNKVKDKEKIMKIVDLVRRTLYV